MIIQTAKIEIKFPSDELLYDLIIQT